VIGCFRFGTGIKGNTSIISRFENVASALACQSECQKIQNCKLFNWNQESYLCFPRSDLPNGLNSFNENVAMSIIGARDCSDFWIIWPEVYGLDAITTYATTATTTITSTTTTTYAITTTTSITTTTTSITTTSSSSSTTTSSSSTTTTELCESEYVSVESNK